MDSSRALYSTFGRIARDELGMILPHEHIYVEFRPPSHPEHARSRVDEVVPVMAPELSRIKQRGVTAMVDCTPLGVGRRADIVLAVSQAAGLPVLAPTGIYREPWVPGWAIDASERELEAWMLRELTQRFDEADFRAGWIKLSAGDDGLTEIETKILRAAARVSAATGAAIGSHTIKGRVVMDQLDILEAEGADVRHFISIHTQAEPDIGLNHAVAARGAWIEFDNIGWVDDEQLLPRILGVLAAGHGDRLLLSHDMGWYDPAKPNGGPVRPYTHLSDVFLPKLRAAGVSPETILQLTADNPFEAFARP